MPTQTISLTDGGEFADSAREAEYRAQRLPEWTRHARLAFLAASLLNILFYLSDFRFHGLAHFPAALTARTTIVLASLACFAAARRVREFRGLALTCAAWSCVVIPASAVLVSPHTDIALFIIFVLPVIFYLVMPMSFAWTLAAGLGCSLATLAAYMAGGPLSATGLGLVFAMLTNNVVLVLVLTRSNRMQRLEWAARQAENAANAELSEHRQMLQGLLKAVPAPLVVMTGDGGRLVQANDAARAYFGPALAGSPVLGDCLHPADFARLTGCLQTEDKAVELETRLSLPGGVRRDVLLAATATMIGGRKILLLNVVDITGRKEMEARLEWLATSDPLTGLANRTRFFAQAGREIARKKRTGRSLAVVMLDIDLFKQVNDTCGHEAGDRALRAFADLCRGRLRGGDVVARMGGEEFAVLLPETDRTGALEMAERLRAAVEGLRLEGLPLALTVSAGVSEVLPGETLVDGALSRADLALYAAKRAGRNRAVLYGEDPDAPVQGQ
jgi:diguanylate cyclase (GGDEF)-like protein